MKLGTINSYFVREFWCVLMTYNVLDLFAGAGGMSLGFSTSGFSIEAAIEIDKRAAETHQTNFPGSNVYQSDINDINPTSHFSKEQFDVIIGGPPCQGFSTIGRPKIASLKRREHQQNKIDNLPKFIDDPRNILYKKFVEFVDKLKPNVFVMENVQGLMSFKNGRILHQILHDFKGIGYNINYKILLAASFGVPQLRKRIIFIGNRLDIENLFPVENHSSKNGNPNSINSVDNIPRNPYVTIGDAILDLPEIDNCSGSEEMDYTKQPTSKYQKLMRQGSSRVYNHVSRCTNERDIRAFKALKEGQKYKDLPQEIKDSLPFRQDIFQDKFKRLDRRKPSWTIVAHLYKDGYMYIHPTQNRSITVREAARIQSFPDRFIFKGSRTAQFKQVGNAVPPLMAQAIAESVLKMLN